MTIATKGQTESPRLVCSSLSRPVKDFDFPRHSLPHLYFFVNHARRLSWYWSSTQYHVATMSDPRISRFIYGKGCSHSYLKNW